MKRLRTAIGFLTVFPIYNNEPPQSGDLGKAAGWYPLIGAIIGALVAAGYHAFSPIFPSLLAASLAVVIWVAISGGLHLDGLADCCDGMLNASSRERRLEIMKDSRLGSFGGIGLILALGLKVACLASLSTSQAWVALPFSAALARWLLLPAGKQPAARPGGMGADFSLGLSRSTFLFASLTLAALIVGAGWRGLGALALVSLTGWLITRLANSRLGGLTGDVFGLLVEVSEIIALLVFCLRV